MEKETRIKRMKERIKRKIRSACGKRKDEWFELFYRLENLDEMEAPKTISFKKHIQILKERYNDYSILLDKYNKLVDAFNELQKAFYEATGEYYEVGE